MNVSQMVTRTLERLDEMDAGAVSAVYYGGPGEVLAALNEAQRFFVLLTLALETTVSFPVTGATTFFSMRSTYQDWLLPLRVTLATGTRVRPARIDELDALDTGWQATPGIPARYAALGFDFFIVYPQYADTTNVNITYTRSPVPMAADADEPEIPEQHHPDLVDYAVYRVRAKEGGQEFAKGLPYFNRFLDGAQAYGKYVRARNLGSGYDKEPFELELFDRSKLMRMAAGG